MSNVNDLNKAWIESGHKVEDLQSKVQSMATELVADPKKYSDEDLTAVKNELSQAKQARDFAKTALDNAQDAATAVKDIKKPVAAKPNAHKVFADGIRDLISGKTKFLNLVSSGSDQTKTGDGGLTIPDDIETRINELIRQYDALQPLVNTESVSTTSGSRVIEKFSVMTPLVNLDDETASIGDNDDPQLATVKYTIHRYAGITKATNSLLKDSDEAIITWLTNWIAKKVVVTRNAAIIAALNNAPKKPTIAKFDDVKDLATVQLDPAINKLGSFVTNNSGFAVLNKVKDAMGNYLLQRDPTKADGYVINGRPVTAVSDNWLPDNVDSKGAFVSHPLYFGDYKDGITLFDRENMSLATTTEGGDSFVKDQTWIRVIDRFDVESVDDGAIAAGSFAAIADQTANFPAAAATTNTTSTN